MNEVDTIESLIKWINTVVPERKGLLVPVSGGSDSALCFWLCTQAFGNKTKALYLGTDLREYNWFTGVGEIELKPMVTSENPEVARWATFLSLAIAERRALIGSRNHTEEILGTYSNASRVATILPLSNLWKTQVMQLCDFVGIPKSIIDSSKKADPECGRPQKMADIPFVVVDTYLRQKTDQSLLLEDVAATKQQHEYLETIYVQNHYKQQLPVRGPLAEV